MRPKQGAALKKLFKLLYKIHSPPDKILFPTSLEQKLSDRDIQKYTDICFQSASGMQFLSVQKWCSTIVFPITKQKHVCWKISKFRKVLACVLKAYYFKCQLS